MATARTRTAITDGGDLFVYDSPTAATLGGRALTTRKVLLSPIATEVERKGDTTLFPLTGRCARAKIAVSTNQVHAYRDANAGGGLGGMAMGRGGLGIGGEILPARSPLVVGGHRVGRLVHDYWVHDGARPVCLQVGLYIDQPHLFRDVSTPTGSTFEACAPATVKLIARKGAGNGLGGLGVKPRDTRTPPAKK